jgi:hypothetical protein
MAAKGLLKRYGIIQDLILEEISLLWFSSNVIVIQVKNIEITQHPGFFTYAL